jgi:hypothetical protein
VTFVGIGDIIGQHPVLFEILVIGVITFTLDVLILQSVLTIVGFGPSGPVKGQYLTIP